MLRALRRREEASRDVGRRVSLLESLTGILILRVLGFHVPGNRLDERARFCPCRKAEAKDPALSLCVAHVAIAQTLREADPSTGPADPTPRGHS
jgi:hypothetical protein